MKTIITAIVFSGLLTVGMALAFSGITTPSCSLTVSPATVPLGAGVPVSIQWTTSGGNVSVIDQHEGATGFVNGFTSSALNGSVIVHDLATLTNKVIVTVNQGQGSSVCTAIVYGTSNHQPN